MRHTQMRDSVQKEEHRTTSRAYICDSIYIREKGDTVYVDRWHTEIRDSVTESHDTVRVVERDSIPYEVEVPVEIEKPLPKWVWKGVAVLVAENVLFVAVIVIKIRRRKIFY